MSCDAVNLDHAESCNLLSCCTIYCISWRYDCGMFRDSVILGTMAMQLNEAYPLGNCNSTHSYSCSCLHSFCDRKSAVFCLNCQEAVHVIYMLHSSAVSWTKLVKGIHKGLLSRYIIRQLPTCNVARAPAEDVQSWFR